MKKRSCTKGWTFSCGTRCLFSGIVLTSLIFSGALTVSGGVYAVPVFAKTVVPVQSLQTSDEGADGTAPEEQVPSDNPDDNPGDSPTPDEQENPVGEAPPDEGQAPPDEGEAPPDEGQAPPDEGEAPPDEGQVPPDEGEAPPDEGQAPPDEGEAPPDEGQVPPDEDDTPPSEGELPPDEVQPEEELPEDELLQLQFAPGPFPKEPQVGGFVIEVHSLKGYNLTVGKVDDETSERRSEPQAEIGLENVTLRGMNLYKNLTTSDGTRFHIQITTRNPSDEVQITGTTPFYRDLETQVSELYAKEMTARVLGIIPITLRDFWDTEPERNLLIILGSLLDLGARLDAEELKLNAHRLQAKKIVIPNLVLTVGEGHLSSSVQ